MNINKLNNTNTSFSGIKLSVYKEPAVRRIAKYLRINGYNCAGKKTYYVSNEFAEKQKIANYIRNHYGFENNEYGVMFLPWSKETYIISAPEYEQRLLEWVQEMDSEACINLMI